MLDPAHETHLTCRRALIDLSPGECWLDASGMRDLREALGHLGIVGGSVYDALVGQAATANRRILLTRDRRAERTYRLLEVKYQFIE